MADPITISVLAAAATAIGSAGTVAQTAYAVRTYRDKRRQRKEDKLHLQQQSEATAESTTSIATSPPPPQQVMPMSPNGVPMYPGYYPGQYQTQSGYSFTTVTYGPPGPQNGWPMPGMGYPQPTMGYMQQPIGYGMPPQGLPQGYPNPTYFGSIPGQQYPVQAIQQAPVPLALTYNVPPEKHEVAELDLKKGKLITY